MILVLKGRKHLILKRSIGETPHGSNHSCVWIMLYVCSLLSAWRTAVGRRFRGAAGEPDGRAERAGAAGLHVGTVVLHVHGAVRRGVERPGARGGHRGTSAGRGTFHMWMDCQHEDYFICEVERHGVNETLTNPSKFHRFHTS